MSQIEVTINGTTYQLDSTKPEGLSQVPWQDRKAMLEVFEVMRTVDHVIQEKSNPTPAVVVEPDHQSPPGSNSDKEKIKPETISDDPDLLMQQFLSERPQQSRQIPDKSSVYKVLAVMLAVIILLAWLF